MLESGAGVAQRCYLHLHASDLRLQICGAATFNASLTTTQQSSAPKPKKQSKPTAKRVFSGLTGNLLFHIRLFCFKPRYFKQYLLAALPLIGQIRASALQHVEVALAFGLRGCKGEQRGVALEARAVREQQSL